jgi:hypothetical protein
VGSVACAAGVSALALAEAGDDALVVGVRLVAVGLLALMAAVVLGWSSLVAVSLVLLGSAYAVHFALDDPTLDTRAPVVAAGLLLAAELAYWSLEQLQRVRTESREQLRHLAVVAALGLGGLFVGAVLLAVADVVRTRGLAVDLFGAGAAASALLLLVLIARRPA